MISYQINISKKSDYFQFFEFMHKEIHGEIEVNLNVAFLEPYEVLLLAEFVIHQAHLGCHFTVNCKNGQVSRYLDAIEIKRFCNSNWKESTTMQEIPSHTAMPLKRLAKENMSAYITATQTYFHSFCPDKDLTMLDTCLSELLNNAYDHAHSKTGALVFCQYYPRKEEIKVAVSDLGIGIPFSVNTFLKKQGKAIKSQRDSLKWALEENNTTKSIPQNLGKGLDNIKSFISATDNSWYLLTGKTGLSLTPSGLRYIENPINFFKGTISQLTIDLNSFEVTEIVGEMDWF